MQMVYVDATAILGRCATSGCVGGGACGGYQFALPDGWRRNSLVGGGGIHQRSCSVRAGGRLMRARRIFAVMRRTLGKRNGPGGTERRDQAGAERRVEGS